MVPYAGASDHEEDAMSDSYRLGWPPGPRPDAGEPEAVPARAVATVPIRTCTRVRARSGHWWRRCRCSGYTRLDSADYAPGA